MRIVDVHNHFYPPAYLDALKRGESSVTLRYDTDGNPEIHYPGDYNVLVPGHREIAYRQGVLEKEGVDTQVITLTTPGTHVESPAVATRLAQLTNDDFARIVQERSPRFAALATLPLNDPAASLRELKRAHEELKLPGAMFFSNVNGVALADERFWPLYEYASSKGLVLHIHPTHPVGVEAMTEYWLMPLVGFLMDTTLAAGHLVFAGVPERFPNIKWVLSHLGGAVPYLVERFDRGYRAFADCRKNIRKPPSEYLKTWYYDTVNFNPKAVELAINFAGADHIMAGSDYPHAIGSIPLMKQTLADIGVSETDRAKILGANAARVYGL
ncbi:MAG: amidohydrolase [Gemmatimonadetes bacterium]|nr:amidohydrolase [Gemmatimonadota bacterium]